MTRTIELTGSVQAAGEAAIVARASGYLDTLTVDLGDRIRAGMPIGTLVAPEVLNRVLIAKAELARREMAIAQANQLKTLAETRLAETDAYINVAKSQVIASRTELGIKKTIASMARVTLERTRLMTLEGAATQQSLDEAELALTNAESEILIADSEVASKSAHLSAAEAKKGVAAADVSAALSHISVRRAEADKAKAELNGALQEERWLTIQSPISGTVTARHVHPGIFVRDALQSNPTVLVQIQADGPVRIRFEVPSSDADLVKKGMTAQVRARGHDGWQIEGPVVRVSGARSTTTRSLLCELDLEDARLVPGMFVSITLKIEHREDALVVPLEALSISKTGATLFVVQDETVQEVSVELGLRSPHFVEVTSRLDPSTVFVLRGKDKTPPGTRVASKFAEAAAGSRGPK